MDTGVTERSGGEFEITEVAGENLRGHGHDIVDEIDKYRGGGEVEKESQFDPRGGANAGEEGNGGVGEYSLEFAV